jgi:hypothetical protein
VYFWTWGIGNNKGMFIWRRRLNRICYLLTFSFRWNRLLLIVRYVHFMSSFHYLIL